MPLLEDLIRRMFSGDEYYVEPLERPIDPRLSDMEVTAQRIKERKYKKGLSDRPDLPLYRWWNEGPERAIKEWWGDVDEESWLKKNPREAPDFGAPPPLIEKLQRYSGEKDARSMINDLASAVKERVTPPAPEPDGYNDLNPSDAISVSPGRIETSDRNIPEEYRAIADKIRQQALSRGYGEDSARRRILEAQVGRSRGPGLGLVTDDGRVTMEDVESTPLGRSPLSGGSATFGREMLGAGGGTFSIGPDSPAIRQRQKDLEEWLANGALRDAEYALSPEMSRRDPAGANRAAEMLTGLKRERTLANEQKTRDKFVQALADSAGKIPFEKAVEAEQLGLVVPHQLRGMSQEEFDVTVDEMIAGASTDMNRALGKVASGEVPMEKVGDIVSFSKYSMGKLKGIKEAVAAGQMTRDEAVSYIRRLIQFQAESSGVIDTARTIGVINQMQAPVAGE
jgi:hypothetical protein